MKRQNVGLAIGVAVVVGVATFVGILGGRITQRAPRGPGARVAVVDAGDKRTVIADAVSRALAATPDVTVIPDVELRARQAVLASRHEDASPSSAAHALDLAGLVVVSAQGPKLHASFGGFDVDGDTAYALASAIATKLGAGPVPPFTPPSDDPAAYAAFVEGRAADAAAIDPQCAPCFAAIGTADALAKAKGSPRLSHKEALLVEGKLLVLAAADEKDVNKHGELVENALNAFRKMTVEVPEEPEGYFELGVVYHRVMSAHDESLHYLESARRLVPTDLVITREVADAWMHMGDRKHALQAVRGYLAIVPGDADAKKLLEELTNAPVTLMPVPGR